MKRFRVLTVALCAAVLLCGFSVTAYASSGEDYGDPTMTAKPVATETPTPEAEPKPFTPSGTGTVVNNATDEDGKEFYTITTPSENVFYLVIDRQRGTENVYFLNAVTEADLLALAELPEEVPVVIPEPEPTTDPEPAADPKPDAQPGKQSNSGMLLLVAAVVLVGGGAAYYFKIVRPKQQRAAEAEEDYYEESESYADDTDDGPPWDEEDADAGEPKE